ncbi:putative membrane protein [Streptomyces davaonensis JCM 4913]|uniref:Putative membrane protein n=1 Tax=Streptomyces davaonensis (strain DSM 101723 / JCM 4913 / KCC S-0913 / 768) TaxID=1214101 RepID=K4R8J9_STRDJ|nr:DUF6336 family protein [Streptomyces davaonensis]CCK29360.1 putative membrane protein [Streptomyces davaonensis JCM 4913]
MTTLDEDGVITPRLRLRDVLLRGSLFGLFAALLLAACLLFVGDHHDREEFFGVFGGLMLIFGAGFLVFGLLFWLLCRDDIRRFRDWGTITTQSASATLVGPAFVRIGLLGLIVGLAGVTIAGLVDQASYDSWIYGD